MSYTSSLLTVLILMLVLCTPCVHAQNLDPIENYLKSAEDKANSVVNNAGAQGRGIAMEAGQALLNAISTFRSVYADALKKTETALSGQQAEFFQNIRLSTAQLDQYTKDATTRLDGIADKLDAAARSLPFASDIPRVTRITPLFVAESQVPSKELVVKGVGLANKEPILWIDGKSVRPTTSTDSEIRFQMPRKNGQANGTAYAAGVLQVFERRPGLVFSSYVEKYYPVRVAIRSDAIGSYSLLPRFRAAKPAEELRTTAPYRCESSNGEGRSTVPASVTATEGWRIDKTTITWKASHSDHGGTTLNSQSEAAFTATIWCDGYGKIPVVDAGKKGVESGSFQYKEYSVTNPLVNGNELAGNLKWHQTVTETLPDDTETTIFALKLSDTEKYSVEGTGDTPYFAVTLNRQSRVITITPKDIDAVLRR